MCTKDIYGELVGESAPPHFTVAWWSKEFNLGRTSIKDEQREGRPSVVITGENVKKIS